MTFDIQPEPGYLNVVATGRFSLPEAKRTFLQMLEAIALHKCTKALFDGREIDGNPTTIERFYYSEFAAKSALDIVGRSIFRPPQFAYVLREPMLDPTRFGEDVAVNRGMWVKAFDNPEQALQWLGVAPATKLDRSGDACIKHPAKD